MLPRFVPEWACASSRYAPPRKNTAQTYVRSRVGVTCPSARAAEPPTSATTASAAETTITVIALNGTPFGTAGR